MLFTHVFIKCARSFTHKHTGESLAFHLLLQMNLNAIKVKCALISDSSVVSAATNFVSLQSIMSPSGSFIHAQSVIALKCCMRIYILMN